MHRALQRRPTCLVGRVSHVGVLDPCPARLKHHLQATEALHSSHDARGARSLASSRQTVHDAQNQPFWRGSNDPGCSTKTFVVAQTYGHCSRRTVAAAWRTLLLMGPTLRYQLSHHGYIFLTPKQRSRLANSSASTEGAGCVTLQ